MPQPNATFWNVMSRSREVVLICGSFAPAGTGTITGAKGDGWAATRSGVGVFTITFEHNWQDLIAAIGTVQLSTAADMDAQVGDYTAASRTLVLRTVAGATETDIAADANNRVHFVVAFKKTSTTPANLATVS
jgi:hypothetical protein